MHRTLSPKRLGEIRGESKRKAVGGKGREAKTLSAVELKEQIFSPTDFQSVRLCARRYFSALRKKGARLHSSAACMVCSVSALRFKLGWRSRALRERSAERQGTSLAEKRDRAFLPFEKSVGLPLFSEDRTNDL